MAIRVRPNYFLSFRINNPLIHKKAQEIQNLLVGKNPQFRDALINLTTLHITLGVLNLQEDDLPKVAGVLDQWVADRRSQVFDKPLEITFRGIGVFPGVLFADLVRCENYTRLINFANELKVRLEEAGFPGEKRELNPHLTLVKLSRDPSAYRLKKELRYIYDILNREENDFGSQEIESIQLLEMGSKDIEGFYYCAHQFSTSESRILEERKPRQTENEDKLINL